MTQKFGLPSKDRISIIKWGDIGQVLVYEDGTSRGNAREQHYLDAGYLPENKPATSQYERLGSILINQNEITYQVEVWGEEEIWLDKMAQSDATMERAVEDIWDVVGIAKAPQATKDKHAAKKLLRSQKP